MSQIFKTGIPTLTLSDATRTQISQLSDAQREILSKAGESVRTGTEAAVSSGKAASTASASARSLSTRVEPGDVISASLMNEILDQLEALMSGAPTDLSELQNRVQALEIWRQTLDPGNDLRAGLVALEGRVDTVEDAIVEIQSQLQISGKVRISGFDPPVQTPIGQVLTILGTGFSTTLVNNLVFVNHIPVYNFRLDSDSTHLKIVVPNIANVPSGGMDVTIRVANNDGEGQRTYRIVPALAATPPPLVVTRIVDIQGSPILTVGDQAFIEGTGLGNQQQKPTIRFIFRTTTGPSVYTVDPNQGAFQIPTIYRFHVPDIKEVPINSSANGFIEISFGNNLPLIANVTVRRTQFL